MASQQPGKPVVANSGVELADVSPLDVAHDECLSIGKRLSALVGWRMAAAAHDGELHRNQLLGEIDDAIELLVERLQTGN